MKGIANHATKSYEFSHVLPVSPPTTLLNHANKTSKIWHERFGHLNFKYLQQLHNDKMVDGFPLIQNFDGVCSDFLVGKHLDKRYEVGRHIEPPLNFILYIVMWQDQFPQHPLMVAGISSLLLMIFLGFARYTL